MSAQRLILVIEPEAQLAARLQAELRSAGYRVLLAQRALDALDIARRTAPDLILTDINLPDLSGRELATTLRADERFIKTPIVAIANQTDEERDISYAAGINGFVQTPIRYEALAIQVEFYLSGGTDFQSDENRLDIARTRYLQAVVSQLEGRIRELENKNQELQKIDQMKDTFIQLAAHELRTPLTLITGYSRLLEDHPPLLQLMGNDGEIGTLIKGLSESISRMQGIIEEILTMSRIMTSNIELNVRPISLGKLVQRVIAHYQQALHDRNLTVHFDERQWPSSMRCDPELIQLTIDNLVSNAIKYTPDGGHIVMAARTNSQLVRFSVKDTGVGIAPDVRETIFERLHIGGDIGLHTTSKTAFGGGGLGLGLAICRGIVEAHNGKIWVESNGYDPQTLPGSEFIVILPLAHTTEHRKSRLKRLTSNMG